MGRMFSPWRSLVVLAFVVGCGTKPTQPTPKEPELPLVPATKGATGQGTNGSVNAAPTEIDATVPPGPTSTDVDVTPAAPLVVLGIATPPALPTNAPTTPPFDPTLLGWPPGTTTAEVTSIAVHVASEPDERAKPVGKIVRGTRVTPLAIVPGTKRCPTWVHVAPIGYLCKTSLGPTTKPAGGIEQPVVPRGQMMPGTYFDIVKDGAQAYRDADSVRAGAVAHELHGQLMLKNMGTVDVDGRTFVQSKFGLIAAEQTRTLNGSSYQGIDVRTSPPPAWPFGFAWTSSRGGTIPVYGTPDAKTKPVRKLQRRATVAVIEEIDGFVRIDSDQWLRRDQVRVARITAPPLEAAPDAQWIDVDLDEQVLIAYRGTTPEFVTLISSGKGRTNTPTHLYRVQSKAATTRMVAEEGEQTNYEVSEVPWTVRFRSGLFFHAAYWHDGFGEKRSHGCVNMSPRDSRTLYRWVEPLAPDGWSEREALDQTGPIVRIRDAKNPAPTWFDYANERPNKPPKELDTTKKPIDLTPPP